MIDSQVGGMKSLLLGEQGKPQDESGAHEGDLGLVDLLGNDEKKACDEDGASQPVGDLATADAGGVDLRVHERLRDRELIGG